MLLGHFIQYAVHILVRFGSTKILGQLYTLIDDNLVRHIQTLEQLIRTYTQYGALNVIKLVELSIQMRHEGVINFLMIFHNLVNELVKVLEIDFVHGVLDTIPRLDLMHGISRDGPLVKRLHGETTRLAPS